MKEMLEVGMIHPSQSQWCNAVVLVHKKDGGLCFCIDFHKLNARTMVTGSDQEPGWHRVHFLLGLKGRVLVDLDV